MKITKASLVAVIMAASVSMSSCSWFSNDAKNIKEEFSGLHATIQTFDAYGGVMDNVEGSSISVETDNRFDVKDSAGDVTKESSVLNIQIGGKQMYHVGSFLAGDARRWCH